MGVELSPSSAGVLQRTVDDVVRLKQATKQSQANVALGTPMEIFVPRSYNSSTKIYTGDVYTRNPATGAFTKQLSNQTAELLPETIAP